MKHAPANDPQSSEIASLHTEISRLNRLVAFLAMDTSAGFSRGRIRSGYAPAPAAMPVKDVLDV